MATELLGGGQTDVLFRIFHFLSPEELAQCSAGSRYLNQASNDPFIWLWYCQTLWTEEIFRAEAHRLSTDCARMDDAPISFHAAPKQAYMRAHMQSVCDIKLRESLPDNDDLEVDSLCVIT
jgi:hypothetical protein